MEKLINGISPHVTSHFATRRIMLDVIIAMLPMMAASVLFFGLRSLAIMGVAVAAAMIAELLFTVIRGKFTKKSFFSSSAWDLSCVVTGILVALNVPVGIDLWVVALGSVFAIVIVKMMFGGIGKNFANPALTARLFLFAAFAGKMGAHASVNLIGGLENITGATWLSAGRDPAGIASGWLNMLIGNKGAAAIGETSVIAILLGYVYLVARKVIDFRLPLMIVGGVAAFAFLMDGIPGMIDGNTGAETLQLVAGHVITGGLLMGAVFMATDYASSPNTFAGSVIYALGIALLIVVIRVFGALPEGVSFAIVIMNIVTPLIDKHIVPKPFGKCRQVKNDSCKRVRKAEAEVTK